MTFGLPVGSADWLLVPSEAHVEAYTRAGTPALTLRRLLDDLAVPELTGRAPTTPESTRMLIGRLREVAPAHAHALDQTIGGLRRAGTTGAALAGTQLARGRYFAELLADLDQELERCSLYDDRSSPWAAARRLVMAPDAVELPSGPVTVRGVAKWDNATLALFEALDELVRRRGHDGLSLTLPHFDRGPLREATDAIASELEARWAHRSRAPSLVFEEATLDGTRAQTVEAHDAESEARAVARLVLEALAAGTPLDRIAIVPVDLAEAFLEPLRFELTRAKIPFSEPRGRPAIASPRAHAAIELLRLARGPLGRDALVDVLRVPELDFGTWFGEHRGVVGELVHELSQLPLRFDRSGSDLADELGDHISQLAEDDPEHSARLAPAREGLLRWLGELRKLAEPAPRPELVARALGAFDTLGLLGVSERALSLGLTSAQAGRPELLTALGHDAAGARALQTALTRVVAATHALRTEGEVVTLGLLLEELELALEGVSPTGGAVRAGAVRIGRPRDIAGLASDFVVLCRASDASLDSRGRSDGGLGAEVEARLPPDERPMGGAAEQRFAWLDVAWALSGAKKLAITWASHDASRTLGPSRLARALIASGAAARSEPASSLVPGARPAHRAAPLSDGARHRIATERRRIAFYADPNAPLDAYNGEAGALARFLGGDQTRPLAVTAIERSLRCPFLGFAGNVLRASTTDTVEDAISARERGNLLHQALAAALESVRELWGLRGREELEARAFDAARNLLESRGRSPLRRAGLKSTLLDVAALLRYVFDKDDGFRFELAEQAFGAADAWSALQLGDRSLAGRVDRIDATGDRRRVRVIDYKTTMPTKAETERALQPALYGRKAALELGAEHVEFAYLALERRAPKERIVFSDTADGPAIAEGLARATLAIHAFESGAVPARPASGDYCVRCAARDICRRPLSAPESVET